MNLAQDAAAAALTSALAKVNGGTLVLYSGTAGTPPASPETAATGSVLATWTFQATSYGTPSFASGKQTAALQFVQASVAPSASGTAAYFRAFKSDGTTAEFDLTCNSDGSGDINLGSTSIQTGVNVNLTSVTVSLPAS